MFDIDYFKSLNDNFGHLAADEVLQRVGLIMLASIREEDFACRYGGDEFILVLPEVPLAAAMQKAEQLRERLKQPLLEHQNRKLPPIGFSMGIAVFPDHGASRLQLLQSADTALYRAKQAGRDCIVSAV